MKTAKPSNKVSRIALANNLGVYQRLLWQTFSTTCIETGITGEVLLGVAVGAITRNAFRDRNIGALRRFYTTSEALSPDLMWHLLISRSFLTLAWWSRGWEKYRSGIFSPRFLFLLPVLDRHGLFTLFLFLTVHKRFVYTSSLSSVKGFVLTY